MTINTNSANLPKTIHELGDMAEEKGLTVVELMKDLEKNYGQHWYHDASEIIDTTPQLEQSLRADFAPPAGFRLDPIADAEELAAGGTWSGPAFEGDVWKITTHWTAESGVTFYVDGAGDNAIRGAEAAKIAEALAEVARLAAA